MNNINPWTYAYIRQLVDEATLEAERDGLRPALPAEMLRSYRTSQRFNIPFLGDYVPEGWIQGDSIFVDTSGQDHPASAISQYELFRLIQAHKGENDIGYGVIERGQFQVLVARYDRTEEHEET